jgi:hypothetical protein
MMTPFRKHNAATQYNAAWPVVFVLFVLFAPLLSRPVAATEDYPPIYGPVGPAWPTNATPLQIAPGVDSRTPCIIDLSGQTAEGSRHQAWLYAETLQWYRINSHICASLVGDNDWVRYWDYDIYDYGDPGTLVDWTLWRFPENYQFNGVGQGYSYSPSAPGNITFSALWWDDNDPEGTQDTGILDSIGISVVNNTYTGWSSIISSGVYLAYRDMLNSPPHTAPPFMDRGYMHYQAGAAFQVRETRHARSFWVDLLTGADTDFTLGEYWDVAIDEYGLTDPGGGRRAFYSTALPLLRTYSVNHVGIPTMLTPVNDANMTAFYIITDGAFLHPSPPAPGNHVDVGYSIAPAETRLDPSYSRPVRLTISDPLHPTYAQIFDGAMLSESYSWNGDLFGNYGMNPYDVQRLRASDYIMRLEWRVENCFWDYGIRLATPTFAKDEFNVIFMRMWETANPANQIFNPAWKDDPPDIPRNKLYICVDPTEGYRYRVSLDCLVNPPGERSTVACAALDPSGQQIAGSFTPFPGSGAADMTFIDPVPGGIDDFPIVVGRDSNANSILEPGERIPIYVAYENGVRIGSPIVRGTDQARYTEGLTFCQSQVASWWVNQLWRNAAAFLSIFTYSGTDHIPYPEYTPILSTAVALQCVSSGQPPYGDGSDFREWLTHNCGAQFDSNGLATITEYYWDKDSPVGQAAGASQVFYNSNREYWNTVLVISSSLASAVRQYFQNNPGQTQVTVPLEGDGYLVPLPHQPSWVTPTTIDFGGPIPTDLGIAIGRGRVTEHRVWFTLTRAGNIAQVLSIRDVATLKDLFDLNQDTYYPAPHGASVQIGFGNGSYGRANGRICRHLVAIDSTNPPFPGEFVSMYIGN